MKKILDFIIIFLLVFLIINLFNEDKQIEQKQEIVVASEKNSYTIPASVKLNIENNRTESLSFNSCDDFKLYSNGEAVKLSDSFCVDKTLSSGEKFILDYSSEYDKFQNAGDYLVKVNLLEKEYLATFEVDNKGTITKIFSALLYAPVYNLIIFLSKIFSGSFGFAIIAITIFIRLLLVWPQHKMMLSQRKLQALQPKIKEIQDQYKGNHQMLGMKMMELYKKEKVNPMGSCGFLLIQMPILFVIYNVIYNIEDPSNHYHLYESLKSFDLAGVSYNFFGMDLLAVGGVAGLALAFSVGLVQFIQVKLSLANNKTNTNSLVLEKKKGANDYSSMMPNAETMNKFMLYGMPVMVAVFTYMFPAGLGLYWGVSTTFMIFQQIVVNKIIKKSS